MGNEIFKLVFSLSLSGTLTGLLLLVLRRIAGKRFSRAWHYYIWMVVILRFLLPVTAELNVVDSFLQKAERGITKEAVPNDVLRNTEASGKQEGSSGSGAETESKRPEKPSQFQKRATTTFADEKQETKAAAEQEQDRTAKKPHRTRASSKEKMSENLWLIWLFGAVLMFTVKIVDYRSFLRYACANKEEITDERVLAVLDDVTMDLKIKRNIKVYENQLMISPMLAGILCPLVILPAGIRKEEELRHILTHELMHYKRKDICYKWLCQLTCCIHWFNPFLLLVSREINRLCELSCDEAVVRRLDEKEREEYGTVLLDVADQGVRYRNSLLSTTLVENKKNLKERLKNIINYKRTSKLAVAGSVLVLSLVIAGATVSGAKAMPIPGKEERITEETSFTVKSFPEKEALTDEESQVFGPDTGNALDQMGIWYGKMYGQLYESIQAELDNLAKETDQSNSWAGNRKPDSGSADADKIYTDDQLIAGKDKTSRYYVNNMYSSGSGYLRTGKFEFNGASTLVIDYVNAASTVDLNYDIALASGKFKLVHIGPDKKVTVLAEGSGTGTIAVTLQKGRNCFKYVGRDTVLESMEVYVSGADKTKLEVQYGFEWEEEAALLLSEVRVNGKVDLDKLIFYAEDLLGEDISKCIVELLQDGKELTEQQWSQLICNADEDILTDYYIGLLKNGKEIPFEQIMTLVPYLGGEVVSEYIIRDFKGGKKLTQKELVNLYPFCDGDRMGDYFISQLKKGKEIPFSQFSGFAPYLDGEVVSEYVFHDMASAGKLKEEELNQLYPYVDADMAGQFILECLEAGSNVNIDKIKEILPYLNEDALAACILELMDFDEEEALRLLGISYYYMDEDGIADCLWKASSKGCKITAAELGNYVYFMDEDDFLDVVNAFRAKKVISAAEAKKLKQYVDY